MQRRLGNREKVHDLQKETTRSSGMTSTRIRSCTSNIPQSQNRRMCHDVLNHMHHRSRRGGSGRRLVELVPLLAFVVLFVLHDKMFVVVNASIYINNDTYASLPGLFGKVMQENRIYEARLQFLPENPYLCEPIENFAPGSLSFVKPPSMPTTTTLSGILDPYDDGYRHKTNNPKQPPTHKKATIGDNLTAEIISHVPVVMLAGRGQCPFYKKAMIAQSIDPSIEYLIIYNFNLDSEDTLVPMYSEFGDTRLVLLSITHRAGTALKRYIAEQTPAVYNTGGPIIKFDNIPPEGLLSIEELRNMLLSALGLFFMLISFSGCIMIIAGTYGHVTMEGNRIIFTTQPAGGMQQGVDANGIPIIIHSRRRVLLTEQQVRKIPQYMENQRRRQKQKLTPPEDEDTLMRDGCDMSPVAAGAAASNSAGNQQLLVDALTLGVGGVEEKEEEGMDDSMRDAASASGAGEEEEISCAVCIDNFEPDSERTTLPCNHVFHTECIIPWLTERQSKCPLCKYDVYEYVRMQELAGKQASAKIGEDRKAEGNGGVVGDGTIGMARAPSWFDRVLRYRWTIVTAFPEEEGDVTEGSQVGDESERGEREGIVADDYSEHQHQRQSHRHADRDGIMRVTEQRQQRQQQSRTSTRLTNGRLRPEAPAEVELTEQRR